MRHGCCCRGLGRLSSRLSARLHGGFIPLHHNSEWQKIIVRFWSVVLNGTRGILIHRAQMHSALRSAIMRACFLLHASCADRLRKKSTEIEWNDVPRRTGGSTRWLETRVGRLGDPTLPAAGGNAACRHAALGWGQLAFLSIIQVFNYSRPSRVITEMVKGFFCGKEKSIRPNKIAIRKLSQPQASFRAWCEHTRGRGPRATNF